MTALPHVLQPIADGTPSQQAEQWRYSNVARLARYEFTAPQQGGKLPQQKSSAYALIAVDGKWQDVTLPDGCMLTIQGAHATLKLAENADLELELISALSHAPRAVATQMELTISLGRDAALRLLEWSDSSGVGDAPALQTLTNDFQLGENATLQHVRLTAPAAVDYVFSRTTIDVAADAHYHYFAAVTGGQQSRHQINARLNEAGAQVTLAGAYSLQDAQVADHTILIEHLAPQTSSRQAFRGVVDGSARGIFQGKVYVAQVAQETDAQQLHKALLLSPRAEVDAKPELEIYADNVKCSHGATVGALDDNALFYLRARGIDAATAAEMLTVAFVAVTLEDAPCFTDIVAAQLGVHDDAA